MTQVFRLPFEGGATHQLAGATVLQLIPDLEENPAARAAIDIAVALGEAGARALIACRGGRLAAELQARGGIFVPFPSYTKNPLAMALNARRLAHILAAERADMVHVRSRALGWVAYGAARMTKTPLITSFHSGRQSSNPVTMRYNSVLARGDIVLADSDYAGRLARKLHAPAAGKIRIVHQGIDCRIFAQEYVTPERVQAVRRQWNAGAHEQIVLFPAPVTHASGYKSVIEAALLLSRSGIDGVKFILAGSGKESRALNRSIDRAIAREGLQGMVSRASLGDRPAAYLAAAAVAVPAAGAQALGETVIQAQAMGTPVIAANVGAAPEMVLAPPAVAESSRTGFLVKPGDAAALALSIAKVLSLGASASGQLSERAKKHAGACFSMEQSRARTLDAYAALWRGGR
jgi:glycosyltransferase involved in cell wall biosynthesis